MRSRSEFPTLSEVFELAEVLCWMQALPRMEAHVLDAGHKLLENARGGGCLIDARLHQAYPSETIALNRSF